MYLGLYRKLWQSRADEVVFRLNRRRIFDAAFRHLIGVARSAMMACAVLDTAQILRL